VLRSGHGQTEAPRWLAQRAKLIGDMTNRQSRRRMSSLLRTALTALLLTGCVSASTGSSDVAQRVVDVPTRPGVIQRLLLLSPREPKATVVLFAGDHGGLQIAADGRFQNGNLAVNFLVRSRQLFVEDDLAVAIVDAPSDRQGFPFRFLSGFRQTPAHAADIKAVIAWLREHVEAPLWLIGTSRGTESVGYVATQLRGRDGPDGIVLTSTILADGDRSVPAMELETLRIPVLVVHHEQDGCRFCLFRDMPALMHKLDAVPVKELIAVNGGVSRGDPCTAFAYHGYNGIERVVVARIAEWIVSR
jgi:pimeloyl-ACP methyl ester carboxylesterase